MTVPKPSPHALNLAAALARTAAAHQQITDGHLTHAERHANRLAELRKRIEQNAEITRGIARHTGTT